MIEKLSKYITKRLYETNIISSDFEIYEFGFRLLIPYILECILVILISLSINFFLEAIIYIILFAKIRDYSGGYHANSYFGCAVSFVLLFLVHCLTIELINYHFLLINYIIANIGLVLLAPVSHPMKKSRSMSRMFIKKQLSYYLFYSFLTSLIFFNISVALVKSIYVTIIIVFMLAVLQALINIERNRENEYF